MGQPPIGVKGSRSRRNLGIGGRTKSRAAMIYRNWRLGNQSRKEEKRTTEVKELRRKKNSYLGSGGPKLRGGATKQRRKKNCFERDEGTSRTNLGEGEETGDRSDGGNEKNALGE